MRIKSILAISCLVLALFMVIGTPAAEAQCCFGQYLAAPFVAAGAVVVGAAYVAGAVVTAPFAALSCGSCCNTCAPPPPVTYTPPSCGCCGC